MTAPSRYPEEHIRLLAKYKNHNNATNHRAGGIHGGLETKSTTGKTRAQHKDHPVWTYIVLSVDWA